MLTFLPFVPQERGAALERVEGVRPGLAGKLAQGSRPPVPGGNPTLPTCAGGSCMPGSRRSRSKRGRLSPDRTRAAAVRREQQNRIIS